MLPVLDLLPVDRRVAGHLHNDPAIRNLHRLTLGEKCPTVLGFLPTTPPPASPHVPTALHGRGGPCPCLAGDFPRRGFPLGSKVQPHLAVFGDHIGIAIYS